MRKIMHISFYLLFFLHFMVGIAAGHPYLYKIEEQIEYSDIIVIGSILETKRTIIGYKYAKVKPLQYIKTAENYQEIKIKYGNAFYEEKNNIEILEKNCTYLFFLKKSDNNYIIIGQIYFVHDGMVEFFGEEKTIEEIINIINKHISKDIKIKDSVKQGRQQL